MKFTLNIESNNEGPVTSPDYFTADALDTVAARLRDGFTSGHIRDGGNGGAVGSWSLTTGEIEQDRVDPGKGDRVSYTVMYGAGPGRHANRTEYGKITRVQQGGARDEPQASIAVENPQPGAARYVKRYLTDVTPAPVGSQDRENYS